ncbi:MAG: hypothetical protein EAZ55_02350 [Cytophagales bacterium]|nr:MAG: hypothetical protein EAZ55_02350 [Cytophagales bacterium]
MKKSLFFIILFTWAYTNSFAQITSTFKKYGISFEYFFDWTLEDKYDKTESMISHNDNDSFITIKTVSYKDESQMESELGAFLLSEFNGIVKSLDELETYNEGTLDDGTPFLEVIDQSAPDEDGEVQLVKVLLVVLEAKKTIVAISFMEFYTGKPKLVEDYNYIKTTLKAVK